MRNKASVRFWLLIFGILLMGICFQSYSSYAASYYPYKAVNSLEHNLDRLEQLLAKIERGLDTKSVVSSHLEELAATMNHVDKLVREINSGFASFEDKIPVILKGNALQELAYSRQREVRADFNRRWAELVALVDGLDKFSQYKKEKQLAIIKDCRRKASKLIAHQHNPLQVNNLPLKEVNWENNTSPKISIAPLSQEPADEDLSPTSEASLSPSIIQLAEKLNHDPLKMYHFVKDNINYLPLFGSIKGDKRCLSDKEGSDFDQASLLIALLRAAKIPARYVYGRMRLPVDNAAMWLGVREPQTAEAILQRGGIPYRDEVIRRVWVKAYIDNAWIELDPALKHGSRENNAKAADELSWVDLHPDELRKLQTALDISLDSLKNTTKQPVIEPTGDDLSTNLAETILHREWESTKIPAEFQYRLKVELGSTQGADACTSVDFSITQVLTESLSLVYLPVDKKEARMLEALTLQVEDEADPKHKKIGHLPGYLVKVKPHLLLGDQIIAQGEPVSLGTPQYLSLSFVSPLSGIAPIRHLVVAGTCATIGLNMGNVSAESLNNPGAKPILGGGLIGRLKNYVARLLNEELGLEAFKHTALAYHQQNSRLAELLSPNSGVYAVPFMGEALVSQAAIVTYAFNIPVFFHNSGVNFDLQRNSFVLTPTTGDQAAGKQFLDQAGLYGSILEHRVLQQIDDKRLVDSEPVSAVKAMMIAQRQGIPLLHITPENSKQLWPKLSVSQTILQDIEAAVSRGYEVTLPQEEVSLNDWQGVGYVVRETGTGAAAYLINGGLAGSFGGTAGTTTTITGSLPRGTLGKIIVIILILGVVVLLALI